MTNILLLWQQASGGTEGSPLVTLVFLMVGLGIFYFFMIRPQVKQQQEQKSFATKLKKGSQVVTAGGMHGTITKIEDDVVDLLIASKTTVKVQKDYISLELTKAVYGGGGDEKEEK